MFDDMRDESNKIKGFAMNELNEFRKAQNLNINELCRMSGKLDNSDYHKFLKGSKFPSYQPF